MFYEFPRIEKYSDVEKYVDEKNFSVKKLPNGGICIDYLYVSPEIFPKIGNPGAEIRREFRGITFDRDGRIVARKFHKFFNLGENEEVLPDKVDLEAGHVILDKLDGSMIATVDFGDGVEFHTRKGFTDVARMAYERHCKGNIEEFCRYMIGEGYTLIFEWVSSDNRIVLHYPEDRLVLLAVRHMVNGEYLTYDELNKLFNRYEIPLVERINSSDIEAVRKMNDREGIVIRFHNGHMLKVKSEWYVHVHAVKEDISRRNKLAILVLQGALDDIMSVLDENSVKSVRDFSKELIDKIDNAEDKIRKFVEKRKDMDRKNFAFAVKSEMPSLAPFLFKAYGGSVYPVREELKKRIDNNSKQDVAKILDLLGVGEPRTVLAEE